MSGDVQPRKRKDKRRKKDVSNLPAEYRAQKMRVVLEDLSGSEDVGSSTFSSDETIHVHKDTGTGGNICAKVVFFLLLGALAVMVGLILTEYRGSSDVDTPVAESRWAQVFDGWVDESPLKHDEHDKQLEQSGEHNDEHSEETEEHGDDEHEEEEVESEEAQFPEEEEEQVPEESEEGLQEEEDGEEEEEEEEEEDEQEVSEEELEGIPGVTESDEEEDEGDGENAEDDDEEEEEEEEEAAAAGEEDEARRMSTVAPEVKPMTETSSNLPIQSHSQARDSLSEEFHERQQSKGIHMAVSSKGDKEQQNMQLKSEEVKQELVNQSAAKQTTSNPQFLPPPKPDRANKMPDSALGASVVQEISPSHIRDGERVQQGTSDTTFSNSQKPVTSHTSEQILAHTATEKPIPTKEQTISQTPTEKLGAPHIPAEKPNALHTATDKPSTLYTSTEKSAVQHISTGKPSSSNYQVPPPTVTQLKAASQAAHAHDLRGDKLELSIAEKVTEVHSYSEYSKSAGVKPVLSQVSSKVAKDGTKQDIYITQQRTDVEGFQRAQTPSQESDSVTHSSGNVPKEASVLADKSESKIPETAKNASRTSAFKHKKVGGEDGDEGDGDNDDEEAVEETKEEEVEGGEAEGDHESAHEEDGGDDDDEDEPSGDDGVTVQPTVPGQAIGTDHGVEEITPDLIERRQTLIPQDNAQDDLEGSEYSEDEDAEDEEEKLQKVEMLEDYMTKYRQQAPTKKEYTKEEKRVSPAESEEDAGEEEEGEKDTKEDSEEAEEEESEEEEEQPRAFVTRAADITPEESGTEEDESEEAEFVPVRRVTKSSGGQGYEKTDVTSEDDLKIREDLDLADAEMEERPEAALRTFTTILMKNPASPRAHHGKARALDKLAEKKHSNALLQEAIDAYERVLALGLSVPDKLFVQAAERCINRMRFKGQYHTAVHIHKKLIQRFSDDPAYPNQLAVTYLMINRLADAKHILEDTLRRWPENGFAQVHYGFILKTSDNNNEAAVDYLTQGIATREPGTLDGRFFFHLGDALTRLGRHEEAGKIYDLGVREGLFLSKYQRSLYNVNRLRAQPWWTPEETTYSKYFKKLQDNWQQIREEGLMVLANKIFKDEAENLKDIGNWQQFELFARGRRITSNCLKAPFTCQLISEFPAARDCRRGQAKFSVMHAGTHVWPHCGPTNCRLRSHLGLIVPEGTYIRVAEETRTWKEGKLFVFDDSFEHEVWHNGTTTRLVLIVDVWHPELTEDEKRSMPAI
ncbi:Aspartyl/asparaginyl beta-hydroxylase [Zootermopsis nevadensis]|uniref:Aspartyl/asparaginyl beta-hydroxylase n=1 Tax=Zootermopsis nevadensis TaxID=136037 RepID=A0A067QY56_ZOONE|nr:Aspartyl/asparaginyl beta-hydroxylase [Zootermopsis nevadensis]